MNIIQSQPTDIFSNDNNNLSSYTSSTQWRKIERMADKAHYDVHKLLDETRKMRQETEKMRRSTKALLASFAELSLYSADYTNQCCDGLEEKSPKSYTDSSLSCEMDGHERALDAVCARALDVSVHIEREAEVMDGSGGVYDETRARNIENRGVGADSNGVVTSTPVPSHRRVDLVTSSILKKRPGADAMENNTDVNLDIDTPNAGTASARKRVRFSVARGSRMKLVSTTLVHRPPHGSAHTRTYTRPPSRAGLRDSVGSADSAETFFAT